MKKHNLNYNCGYEENIIPEGESHKDFLKKAGGRAIATDVTQTILTHVSGVKYQFR